jgi:hypothetical protein
MKKACSLGKKIQGALIEIFSVAIKDMRKKKDKLILHK